MIFCKVEMKTDNKIKCPMNFSIFAENAENAIALNAYSDIQNRTGNPKEDPIFFILSLQQNICFPKHLRSQQILLLTANTKKPSSESLLLKILFRYVTVYPLDT